MGAAHTLRGPRRGVARRLAHSLRLGALIVAAGALSPAAAGAAGILVRLSGGERHFSLDEVDAAVDRPAGDYLLRARGTRAQPVAHPPALSMRRLVALAGASPDAISFLTIERPNGTLAILRRADLSDPPAFPDGPPIVWIDSGGTRYLRPMRGPGDANAADNIGVTEGNLEVGVHGGRLLHVTARADRRQVGAGQTVSLSAQVSGASAKGALAFEWTFGDGAGKAGRAVHHRFRRPGVYEAVVMVNGTDDSGGASAPLRIRVGDLPEGAGDTGGGEGDRRRSPAQGPVEGDGGDGDSSSSTQPSTSSPGDGRGGSGHSSSSTQPSSSAPDRPGRPDPPTTTSTPEPRRPRAAPAANGELIGGTLVAAAASAPPPGRQLPAGPSTRPAARRGTDPRSHPFGWLAGIVACATLLWVGARRERRWLGAGAGAAS